MYVRREVTVRTARGNSRAWTYYGNLPNLDDFQIVPNGDLLAFLGGVALDAKTHYI